MTAIAHDPARQRFTTEADGQAACLEYGRAVGLMTITHTIVPPDIGGRGIAGDLVRTALEYARAEGVKVTPRCSYADGWMRKHPEYDALRA